MGLSRARAIGHRDASRECADSGNEFLHHRHTGCLAKGPPSRGIHIARSTDRRKYAIGNVLVQEIGALSPNALDALAQLMRRPPLAGSSDCHIIRGPVRARRTRAVSGRPLLPAEYRRAHRRPVRAVGPSTFIVSGCQGGAGPMRPEWSRTTAWRGDILLLRSGGHDDQ